jgi:hypothetical protein
MTAPTVADPAATSSPDSLPTTVLALAGSGPVAVLTEDDAATTRATQEIAGAGGGTRLEGVRTTTSPVLRRAVADRVALGQVDVVVVSAAAWEASPLPGVVVVDTRRAPGPAAGPRYVLCRLGAR